MAAITAIPIIAASVLLADKAFVSKGADDKETLLYVKNFGAKMVTDQPVVPCTKTPDPTGL